MKIEKINIANIKKGDVYQHLPSREMNVFCSDDELAFDVLNLDNYTAWSVPLDTLPTPEEIEQEAKWVSADNKPPHNIGVLVFIPEEDNHITSGMWDISDKWVLLDDYRVPECEVTHWRPLPEPLIQ